MKESSLIEGKSAGLCGIIALVLALVLSLHAAMTQMLPIADGQGYAMRAFALYGFLHTGQWMQFWHLLARPTQALLPPHDLLFFMLPRNSAGPGAYLVLQFLVSYLLLAGAIWMIARILKRPEWAPIILLLCGVNNIALIDFYTFYLDMTFMSVGLMAIAFQMKAWSEERASVSISAGIMLGFVFMLKPANAVIFCAVYMMAEIFRAANAFRSCETKVQRKQCLAKFIRSGCQRLVGFLPVAGFALLYGAGQTILQLIDQNEVSRVEGGVDNGGLLRLLYFPLCLSVFYHVVLLGSLLGGAGIWSRISPRPKDSGASSPFPLQLLIPQLVAYFILGEFFSFWALAKPMRALLLVLPLFWFGFCWLWEKRRLRMGPLLLAAILYACAVFAQKEFDLFRAKDQLVEANYSLTPASFIEMPSPWFHGARLTHTIIDQVCRDIQPSGIICVSAIETRNALAWRLQRGELLDGKTPSHDVRFLFDFKGDYYDKALVGANAIVLITFTPVQSSRAGWLQSMAFVAYGDVVWCGANPIARHLEMPAIKGESIGHEFIFDRPLTSAEVDRANQSPALFNAPRAKLGLNPVSLYGRHYSREEGWQLLRAWLRKRFGRGAWTLVESNREISDRNVFSPNGATQPEPGATPQERRKW